MWHTAPPLPAASGLSCHGKKSRFHHWEERLGVGRTGGFSLVALRSHVLTPALRASSLPSKRSPTELSPTPVLSPLEKGKLGMWLCIPVIPTLGSQKQESQELQASLGYKETRVREKE